LHRYRDIANSTGLTTGLK